MTATKIHIILLLSGFGVATALSCLPSIRADEVEDGPIPAKNEVVMSPGMKLTATTKVGTITIEEGV